MKKLSFLVLAAALLASCGYKTKTIELKSEADSVNYALGAYYSNFLRDSSDEAITEFLDAVKAGYKGEYEGVAPAVIMGQSMGVEFKTYETEGLVQQPQLTFNGPIFMQAIVNTWLGDTTTLPTAQAMKLFQQEPPADMAYETVPAEKCPTELAKVELKNFMDSINYAVGSARTEQWKEVLEQSDTITPKDQLFDVFVENINKGLKLKVHNLEGYFGGRQMGEAFRQMEKEDTTGLAGFDGVKFDFDIFFQAMINGVNQYDEVMSKEEAGQYLQNLSLEKHYGEWKKQNEDWLKQNAAKDSIQTTPSGLQYKVLREGQGDKPTVADTVEVDYEGKLINDTIFDSSYERKQSISFPLGNVIRGWQEGLQLMSPGAKYMLYIPQDLGYGSSDQGVIKPFSTLIFTVELKSVKKAQAQPAAPAEGDLQIQQLN